MRVQDAEQRDCQIIVRRKGYSLKESTRAVKRRGRGRDGEKPGRESNEEGRQVKSGAGDPESPADRLKDRKRGRNSPSGWKGKGLLK